MEALKVLVLLEYEAETVHDQGHDHVIRATIFGQGKLWCVQVIKRLTKAAELQALINKNKVPHTFLLITGFVPLEAATRLHKGGIQFIDTVGNAFVNQPPLFIFVKGNKPEKEKTAVPAGRLFKGVGLKITYLLLCRPELADRPERGHYPQELERIGARECRSTLQAVPDYPCNLR
jgi:hypothetical protein